MQKPCRFCVCKPLETFNPMKTHEKVLGFSKLARLCF